MTEDQARLVEENLPLVTYTIKKYFSARLPIDREDVQQIGSIGLCKAAMSYRPDKGYAFSTYAARCIQNELEHELRKLRAEKRAAEQQTLSLDGQYGEEDVSLIDFLPDPAAGPERMLEAQERYKAVKEAFADDPILWETATKQMTQREAAELLGVSQPEVNRRIKAIINRHLRKEHPDDQDQHECGGNEP